MGAERQALAQRVVECFASSLSSRTLCFLDDQDASIVRLEGGPANRGFYLPVDGNTPLDWLPEYVSSQIYVDDGVSMYFPRVVDDLVYLHGSTCADDAGLVLTLAHELWHAVQHSKAHEIWAINTLVNNLERGIIKKLNLTWSDIPIEVEARIVSKRVAERILGRERVRAHIDKKIAENITDADAADWIFVKSLDPAITIDIVSATQSLFSRLKDYRSELEAVLKECKKSADYKDIALDWLFSASEHHKAQTA